MKINKGYFVKTRVCTECDWVQSHKYGRKEICPKCGSELETAIGQFEYTKSFLGGIKIINFIRREINR